MTETTEPDETKTSASIEDCTVIWLDATITRNPTQLFQRQNSLDISSQCIRTFVDSDECVEYIKQSGSKYIFLIVSGSLGEHVVPSVHDLSKICQIYIFCADRERHLRWSKSFHKIRGVFIDENVMVCHLKQDVKKYSSFTIPISIGHKNQRSLQDINKDQVNFLWFQLLIEVIFRLPQTSKAKQQMIQEFRDNYADNKWQLSKIDEFNETYTADSAICWYTKDSFVYRQLNRAFRTLNIDIILNYHYFLTDLFKQMNSLYQEQFKNKTETFTVYRGQYLNAKELNRLKSNIGNLVSINTFFSALTSCTIAANFCGNGELRSNGIESVIFELEIDPTAQRRPFAHIDKVSVNKNEKEVLIVMESVFRIEEVDLYNDNIWLVSLRLSNEVKKEVDDLLAYYVNHIGIQPSILELGVLLSKIGDYERAQRFYGCLLEELPSDHYDLGVLYNNLGEIYRQQDRLDEAMEFYKKAIDKLAQSVGFSDEWFGILHSNIATVFSQRGEYVQALIHYHCALFIFVHAKSKNKELFSTAYHGMATIFQQRGDLDMALAFYEKALQIENEVLPEIHPSIAATHNNIGHLYYLKKNMPLALDHMHRALKINLEVLPKNHPQLAKSFESIASIYSLLGRHFEAIQYHLKAETAVDESSLPLDHELREQIYVNLCSALDLFDNPDLSIPLHQKIINLFKVRSPPNLHCITLYAERLGNIHCLKGDRDEAFKYDTLALNTVQQLPRTEKNMRWQMLTADAFQYIGHFDVTEKELLQLLEEVDQKSLFAADLLNHLGRLYDRQRKSSLALKYYTAALQSYMNWSETHSKQIAISHYNIAIIQIDIGDYEQAYINLRQSLDLIQEHEHDIRARFCSALAKVCIKIENRIEAKEYVQHAIDYAIRAGLNDSIITTYRRELAQVISTIDSNTTKNIVEEQN